MTGGKELCTVLKDEGYEVIYCDFMVVVGCGVSALTIGRATDVVAECGTCFHHGEFEWNVSRKDARLTM